MKKIINKNKEKEKIRLERTAEQATRWIGSTTSLFVHTLLFATAFIVPFFGVPFDRMLLVLTTIVSLEAIYLGIFIQMSVNKNSADIEIIQEDMGEIQEDIEEIEEDVDEIQKDVDEIQEDIEEIEEDDKVVVSKEKREDETLLSIQETLKKLSIEIESLKK